MKLQKLIILLICFLMSFVALAQQEILKKKINIPPKEYSAIELVQYIQETSGISFSYKTKLLEDSPNIVIKNSSQTVLDLMQKITASSNADFVVINGILVIKTKKEIQKIIKKTKESNPQAKIEYVERTSKPIENTEDASVKKQKIISGKVIDSETGEVQIGTTVVIRSLNISATTNEYGFFSFPIPEGLYTMLVIQEGFYIEEIIFSTENSQNLTLQIHSSKYILQSRQISLKDSLIQNTDSIQTKTIGYVGDKKSIGMINPLKILDNQSGIQKTGIISSDFSVLGGNYDQNLVLFDDAPIFNPSHLLGYDFIFLPNSIKDVQLYKIYQPSQYGGRLSSVLDIRSKDGNEQKFAIFTEINPIASYTCIESPIVKNHASVILNLRNSNLKWLFHDASGNSLYNYYDGNVKLNFHTQKSRFYYSLYSGGDMLNKAGFNSGSYGIKWINNAHSLRWNYIVNPSLFSNVTLYGSEYNYYLYINSGNIAYWNSKISSGGLKTDFTYFKTHDNTIRYGMELSGFEFNPGNIVYTNSQTNLFPSVSSGTIGTLAMYVSQVKEFENNVNLSWGIRMPLSRNAGPTVQYIFNNSNQVIDTIQYANGETYNSMASLEPRIMYSIPIGTIGTYRVSYTKTTQVIQEISNSETQITSLDIWLPASPNIKPQVARQISTGITILKYNHKRITINTDFFIKSMQNQIAYENHANMLLNPLIEGELRFGKTLVSGVMMDFVKKGEIFSVWGNYTYTHSRMRIQKELLPTIFSRPHDVTCGINYNVNKNIICTTQWNYLSGKPITTPTSYYEYQGTMVPVYDKMLNSRLPAYHSLDISIQIFASKSQESKWQHIFTCTVKNVYARKNPINITFNKSLSNNELGVSTELSEQTEYVTTMLYAGSILPIISYAIKFN